MYKKNVVPGLMILSLICLLLCTACSTSKKVIGNPPHPGFDLSHSDPKAIAIADEVMLAMGGRKAWDENRYLHWNFFGARTLDWDKHQSRVRIESQKDNFKAIVYLNEKKGQIMKNGEQVTNPDSLAFYLEKAKNIWINDSYWIVMPFKLKDSGVTLNYAGKGTTSSGDAADVLSLTFEGVGETPNNRYLVYVDKKSRLVVQWDFYTNNTDETPRFSTPWTNYGKFGNLLLSGDRGGDYQLTEISIEGISDRRFEQL